MGGPWAKPQLHKRQQPERTKTFAANAGTLCPELLSKIVVSNMLAQRDYDFVERPGMNVIGELKGDLLILTIDISAKARKLARPSSTGKTKLIATTNGFINYGAMKVSLNATVPLK